MESTGTHTHQSYTYTTYIHTYIHPCLYVLMYEEKSIYAFWLLIRDLEKRVHNHLCIASTERRVNNLRMLAHPAPRLGCVVSVFSFCVGR
ncbi:hypothetical protein T4D_13306 [Trichinella pseudospiralis]|uniref:Uncharacterized protein n=1 Tax=Trichinella pseudospiralis TaxID=6337 RepID=A0A0V1FRE5_TRIPS|nr:hypothetical protein T4D_13306 [Trichinella pseudospiralis]